MGQRLESYADTRLQEIMGRTGILTMSANRANMILSANVFTTIFKSEVDL